MSKILVFKHGRPSMKVVWNKMENKNVSLNIKSSLFDGFVVREHGRKKQKVKDLNFNAENSVIIRWGNTVPINTNKQTIVYNKVEAIKISNSKGACRKFLQEKGVPVPKTWLSNEINQNTECIYPLIGRPEHHGQGRHFFVCKNLNEVKAAINKGCSYFSEVYDKNREFRVHCFLGKVLAIMEKPKPEDNKIQWNRALNDAPFTVLDRKDWPKEVVLTALNAVKACGLDFSGVDIMANDQLEIKAVICELNTAPTLSSSEYVSDKYAAAFDLVTRHDKRVPHWDFQKFKKPESFAWKNFQLEAGFDIFAGKDLDTTDI